MPSPNFHSTHDRSGLRDTALTMAGLLGFGALTWIFAASRPELPTLREQQRDERLAIREEVDRSEAEALAPVEDVKLSVDEGIELVSADLFEREVEVTTQDPQFVVPDSETARQLASGGAAPGAEDDQETEEGEAVAVDAEGQDTGSEAEDQEAPQPEPEVLALDGAALYSMHCAACHQPDGQGMPAAQWPPLAGSEWLEQPVDVLGRIVLHGLSGPITVLGEEYSQGIMLPLGMQLSDPEVAAVLNHVRDRFSEAELDPVTAAQVTAVREETSERGPSEFWTVEELEPFLEGDIAN